MAGDRRASGAHNHRRRESSSNNNHGKKRSASSRDHPPNTASTSTSDDNSHSRVLSAGALAQLNNENTRRRRHSTSGDGGSRDYASSPRRERERARERARERELERDREWEREVERERERVRRESRRRESTRGDERQRESAARGEDRRRESTARGDERRRRESTARRESTTRRESARRESTTRAHRDRERAVLSADEYEYPRESSRLRKKGDRGTYREVADGDNHDSYEDRRKSRRTSQMRDKRKSGRVVSGAVLEEGRGKKWKMLRGGGGSSSYDDSVQKEKEVEYLTDEQVRKKKKKIWIGIGMAVLLGIILIIVLAVVVSKKNSGDDEGGDKSGLDGISQGSIPPGAPSWLNPFVWADTKDFNLTYTNDTVGDLPIMGLFSAWDDSKKANDRVPALNQPWGDYAKRPARGVNVGGWLSLEPFVTPSLFEYDSRLGIIDEYTLCTYLAARCEGVLEKHYATFVTEDTFREIADAGLDHVRIPFSYWAVEKYDGDPYIFRTSWRYLLRAIEWCRKYGLRVNLDLHGIPGSQNGWNHSGRLGAIGWLNGTDGQLNRQRSLDVHDRLSKFFAQPRYKNIISHYGLANEPKMTALSSQAVLDWTKAAHKLVRGNGVKDAVVVFGDGFRGLHNWQGELQNLDNAALDVHQYVIFNTNQVVFNHSQKVRYACAGWTEQTIDSMNRATGFGPTLVAEWSQADTDCARHLTNVGWGNRWTGTLLTGNASTDVTTPRCPLQDSRCDCNAANADAGQWSNSYKQFLKMFAEAQMVSFEKGWGWFYWVWDTEDAPQWSYKKGLAAGVLPAKAYDRDFDCDLSAIPSFSDLSEAF